MPVVLFLVSQAMQQAGEYLIGQHDYQNFCKIDTSADKSTIRSISSFKITPCTESGSLSDPYQIVQLEIRGQSFLWHQIRCIVAVLILVGQGLEKPEIVRDLLDLNIHPKYVSSKNSHFLQPFMHLTQTVFTSTLVHAGGHSIPWPWIIPWSCSTQTTVTKLPSGSTILKTSPMSSEPFSQFGQSIASST